MVLRKGTNRAEQVAAGFVAIAASGLTGGCQGPVDPPPPPLQCDDAGQGQTLDPTANLQGTRLTVLVDDWSPFHYEVPTSWEAVSVSEVAGASLVDVRVEGNTITVELDLDGPEVVSGSFTLQGNLKAAGGLDCTVRRTFGFTIASGTVSIASARSRDLPLLALQPAEILVAAQDGRRIELVGRTRYEGAHTYAWKITGGNILSREGNRMIWMAPGEPGLYGLELVVDYGRDGLAIDSIVFEVV